MASDESIGLPRLSPELGGFGDDSFDAFIRCRASNEAGVSDERDRLLPYRGSTRKSWLDGNSPAPSVVREETSPTDRVSPVPSLAQEEPNLEDVNDNLNPGSDDHSVRSSPKEIVSERTCENEDKKRSRKAPNRFGAWLTSFKALVDPGKKPILASSSHSEVV